MGATPWITVGRVGALWRYPVKSMLGEPLETVDVDDGGLVGDRRFGVVDAETGMVASAKRPNRWRALLQLRAAIGTLGAVRVVLPDGRTVLSGGPDTDRVLSDFLGRPVTLADKATAGAQLERAIPETVLEAGVDASAENTMLEIAGAAPPGTFFDFSPMQFLTTASLRRAGALHPAGRVEATRYRPNVIVETVPELAGFVENDWVGRVLHLGSEVTLQVLVPSPRCAIPTLAHGDLGPDPDALRVPLRHNMVEIPIEGFGSAPCLGAHATVAQGGRVSAGDEVWLAG
ncbi:MAG: MOSC domain-containing protein [Acidimicrobiia bacterium]